MQTGSGSYVCHVFWERPNWPKRFMSKRNLRSFSFERLENRRLLAADFGCELVECLPVPAETCAIVSVTEDQAEADIDFDASEIEPENNPGDPVVDSNIELIEDGPIDTTSDAADVGVDESTEAVDDSEAAETDIPTEVSDVNELRDPVLGTSGYFGEIDLSNPTKTMSFTPSETGTIDVVVSSSFGESETRVDVVDSNGDSIVSIMTEDLDGFQKLSFDATEGETYEVAVSSDDAGEGYFMVTVDFEEAPPEPVDFHADEMGADSTQLALTEGSTTMAGELELAGDTDTFRFVADNDGKMRLGMTELLQDNATELNVSIHDSSGEMIARGLTNEMVMVSFDVELGGEYFVAVEATDDQTGAYELTMNLDVAAAIIEVPVDFHADAMGEDATVLEWVSTDGQPDSISVTSELETAEDKDAFRFVSPGDGEVVLDLNVSSDNHASDVSIAVYGDQGELIEVIELVNTETTGIVPSEDEAISDAEGEDVSIQDIALEDVVVENVDDDCVSDPTETDAALDSVEVVVGEGESEIEDESEIAEDTIVNDTDGLVVDGTTNEEVTIRFDSTPGVEYHVLVDSLNDIPTTYDLSGVFIPTETLVEVADEADSVGDVLNEDLLDEVEDQVADAGDTVLDDGSTEAIDDMIVCLDDELANVDEAFQDLERSFETLFEGDQRRFNGRGGNPFTRWI